MLTALRTLASSALLATALITPVFAQHAGGDDDVGNVPTEARQFDFLVGAWELDVQQKVSGLAAMIHGTPHFVGSWKAWHAYDDRGLEDELRIMDASGNPIWMIRSLRVFDRAASQWTVVGLDGYRAKPSNATARWQDSQMRVTGNGNNGEGKPYLSRTRFFDISKDAFHMSQDRSYDNGQSWDEEYITITAKRTAAAAAR